MLLCDGYCWWQVYLGGWQAQPVSHIPVHQSLAPIVDNPFLRLTTARLMPYLCSMARRVLQVPADADAIQGAGAGADQVGPVLRARTRQHRYATHPRNAVACLRPTAEIIRDEDGTNTLSRDFLCSFVCNVGPWAM